MKKRIGDNVLSILLLIFIVIAATAGIKPAYVAVSAEEVPATSFDDRSVDDDIDMTQFPVNKNGDIAIAEFYELAFAKSLLDCGNYGLYLYVYNPSKITISEREGANTVNMAVSYGDDGEPDGYKNIPLTLCGISTNKTVYKFKIVDEDKVILKNAHYQNLDGGERQYDIVGVQLWRAGAALPDDYSVSSTYYYSGYAAGYGDGDQSTLTVNRKTLETLPLEVYQTFYRPDGDNGTDNTQDTLYSVFFSVPNEYIKKYGEMTAIHAEWLEAVTKLALITGNKEAYTALLPYVGKDINTSSVTYGYMDNVTYNVWDDELSNSKTYHSYKGNYGYNVPSDQKERFLWLSDTYTYTCEKEFDTLYWLLPTENFSVNSADDYIVPAEDLLEYARNYSKGKNNLIDGTAYSKDLFDSWDDEKTEVRYTKDQTFTLNSYSYSETFLSVLLNSKAYANSTNDSITVNRIQEVEKCDSAEQIEQDYCIDQSDYKQLSSLMTNDSTVYVFHFAVSDYFASEATLFNPAENYKAIDTNARFFQETAYLGFDIIDVTFTNETGKQKVVGVVANPIDVIGDSTPALNTTADPSPDWLPYALVIAGVLVAALAVTRIVKSNTTEDKKR